MDMAGKILKYLSRPASFSIPSTTKTTSKVAFSGPIVPQEARRTKKKKKKTGSESDDEPTSPKVSCMGQVKQQRNQHKNNKNNNSNAKKKKYSSFNGRPSDQLKEKATIFDELFRKSKVSAASMGKLRRLESRREAFAEFDWRKATEEDEVVVSHSAPLRVVEKNNKQEVNLWKRRTLSQPEPLQL